MKRSHPFLRHSAVAIVLTLALAPAVSGICFLTELNYWPDCAATSCARFEKCPANGACPTSVTGFTDCTLNATLGQCVLATGGTKNGSGCCVGGQFIIPLIPVGPQYLYNHPDTSGIPCQIGEGEG